MNNVERIYYTLQENDCNHWFRDNADTLRLAEYLDKKGCIAPPCKVGDIVQVWSKTLPISEIDTADLPEYYEGEVISMRKNKHGRFFKVRIYARWTKDVFDYELGNYTESYMSPRCFTYPMSAIGKTVFLTREEAERALKGGAE